MVGDGEAETGPLEGSWKGISFLNPAHDGAVLPILHLNGAKIAGPTVLGRKDPAEVRVAVRGPRLRGASRSSGDDLPGMHHRFAAALAQAWGRIREIQDAARGGDWDGTRPRWPMIVLRTPKGWTGPDEVDGDPGAPAPGASHQVPLSGRAGQPRAPARCWRTWLRSYRPEELFDDDGRPDRAGRGRANPTATCG